MHPLDNPIWQALRGPDQKMNQGTEATAYFFPEISPFAGLERWDFPSQQNLFDKIPAGRSVSTLVANPFALADNWELIFSLGLYQLVCSEMKPFDGRGQSLTKLNDSHIEEMLALTSLTKPGPFLQRTIDFGNYHGVMDQGKLVAMAGERLHLSEFTEVSAVCTHPDHTGKGYAVELVNFLTCQILQTGKSAFLHVRQDNDRAIQLYQGLGYEIRSEIYFAVIKPKK